MSDVKQIIKVKVLSKISDHNMVYVDICTRIQVVEHSKRLCWIWKEAQWSSLRNHFATTNWDGILCGDCADIDTVNLTKYILSGAKKFIPIREYHFPKSSHP